MTVQEIEASIMQLPMDELLELSTWLEEYQARMWDKQIEDDLASGRLDTILKEVDTEVEFKLYQEVALTHDMPADNLMQGDIAVLLDFAPHPTGGEEGAVLEVFNAVGESIAVVTVPVSAVAPLRADQVPAVRLLKIAA